MSMTEALQHTYNTNKSKVEQESANIIMNST